VNVFVPGRTPAVSGAAGRYAATLAAEAERYGTELGEARHDCDGWHEKLALMAAEQVPVVAFAFGCPPAGVIDHLQRAGCSVWVTVTSADEAALACAAGADALVVQGVEAGGHRGSFEDDHRPADIGLLALLQLAAAEAGDTPLVAAGGIVTGRAIAAVLAAGARAAQLGTAFMLAPEAATSAAHRRALGEPSRGTALTRAFTGRTARGLVNRFMREHGADAPSAYPDVHHLTAPVRAAAREQGDPEAINLWAGQAYPLARERPAAEIVERLGAEAREALAETAARLAAV
jgi:nitronate monooxygenase